MMFFAAGDYSPAALLFALIDSSGNVVVEYKYDAWGNHEATVADETYVALAEINPFRYRGYYFDEETGLYFLQTRYYDPVVGRFISRDSIEYADPETICGLNLYAYCGNNPVMFTDLWGTSWNSFWNGVKNFFTKDIPNFFTKTVPNFFTKTIPDFFVNTVWNDWMVDKLWNQFIVGTVWEKGLVPAWEWLTNTKTGIIVWNSIWVLVSAVGLGVSIAALTPPITPIGIAGVSLSGVSLLGSIASLLMAIFS